ncbi:hypothetical protein FS593_05035 [Lelliottia amnigena]|uniref:hypothetical protein n=1 Tax=Lelliottia amnigena TaxID=61646 RepID=UPI001F42F7D4|nr:hypothetical protein [Lelliottia amnigena]UJD93702.1 hypothetical protein FS593_05035 [Lelliottia amnigena]
MARVIKYTDGFYHLESHPTTTLETLCGICDDPDNHQIGDIKNGKVTCTDCRAVARVVFSSCKPDEVK